MSPHAIHCSDFSTLRHNMFLLEEQPEASFPKKHVVPQRVEGQRNA